MKANNIIKFQISKRINCILKRTFVDSIKGKEEKPTEKTKGGYTDVQGEQMPNKNSTDKFKTPDYQKGHDSQSVKKAGIEVNKEKENKEGVVKNKAEDKYLNVKNKANEGNDKVESRKESDKEKENKPQERKTGAQKTDKLETNNSAVKDVPHGNPRI